MKFILIISLSFSCVHAALYQASARHSNNYQIGDQEVILQSIWEEIEIKIPESKRPLYKNYLSLNEEEKITQVEEEVIEVTPTEEKKKLKGLGGGKEKIAALLSKNREKLKQKQAQSKFDQVKIEEKEKKAEDN